MDNKGIFIRSIIFTSCFILIAPFIRAQDEWQKFDEEFSHDIIQQQEEAQNIWREDPEKSIEIYKNLIENYNYPPAYYKLGEHLFYGVGTSKNRFESIHLCLTAADLCVWDARKWIFDWISSYFAELSRNSNNDEKFSVVTNMAFSVLRKSVLWKKEKDNLENTNRYSNINPSSCKQLLRIAKERGFDTAEAYFNAWFITRDYDFLKISATDNYIPALRVLGAVKLESGYDDSKKEGLELLKLATEKGDAHAAYILGSFYSDNDKYYDYHLAVEYLETAFELGIEKAALDIEHIKVDYNAKLEAEKVAEEQKQKELAEQNKIQEDKAKVDQYVVELIKLANDGDSDKQYELAECYLNGDKLDKNISSAIQWYEKSAENGSASAQLKLYHLYSTGKIVAFNADKSIQNLISASENECEEAVYLLAKYYKEGFLVAGDYRKAVEVSSRLVEKRYPPILNLLGELYYLGNGVDKDVKKGIDLFVQASDLNSCTAKVNLAKIYTSGESVSKDMIKVRELLKQASELDDPEGTFYYYMYKSLIDNKKDYDILLKAVKLEYPQAQYVLGILQSRKTLGMLNEGGEVLGNFGDAIQNFMRAGSNGYYPAFKSFGPLYMQVMREKADLWNYISEGMQTFVKLEPMLGKEGAYRVMTEMVNNYGLTAEEVRSVFISGVNLAADARMEHKTTSPMFGKWNGEGISLILDFDKLILDNGKSEKIYSINIEHKGNNLHDITDKSNPDTLIATVLPESKSILWFNDKINNTRYNLKKVLSDIEQELKFN